MIPERHNPILLKATLDVIKGNAADEEKVESIHQYVNPTRLVRVRRTDSSRKSGANFDEDFLDSIIMEVIEEEDKKSCRCCWYD